MDTSTIGKSVFDEALALAKATGSSLMLLPFCPLKKKQSESAYIFQPGILFRAEWQNLEIHQEWKTFEEHGLELLRTRKDEATAVVTTEFTQNLAVQVELSVN